MAQDAQGRGAILVVEDDPGVRAVACGMLRDLGYKVREADTALAALNSIDRGGPVDLVFSGVIIPGGMNAVDLARELARRRPELPVLLTSGYTAQRFPIGPREMEAWCECAFFGLAGSLRARVMTSSSESDCYRRCWD